MAFVKVLVGITLALVLLYGIYLLLKHEEEYGAGCPKCHTRYIGRGPGDGWHCRLCGVCWADDAEWREIHEQRRQA